MDIKDGSQTTPLPETTPTMAYEEWMAEGRRRFGNAFKDWKFVCPICGNVAAVEDYRPFKDQGANPDSATKECIGRYNGSKYRAFGTSGERGKPCDYALYGLFRLPGVIIKMDDGEDVMSFAFAEVEENHE